MGTSPSPSVRSRSIPRVPRETSWNACGISSRPAAVLLLKLLGVNLGRPGGGVLAAHPQPALVIGRGGQQRPVETLAEPLHRVLRAEKVAAMANLLVGAEGQRCLVNLQRREPHAQHPEQAAGR